ncbi:hypothetical protein [Acaryochloris sp. IP29b_bin.137]|uniref:hypothetical protein n=1 Tax=Acaryochloris sp. IP29b_bin.137 TaxID=2969217 RepID=UPI00260ECA94|nr:hypothetical protein [Acaryochloris sp. IP29b_bin.137]
MSQSKLPISTVLIHVNDPKAGLAWYQSAFPKAKKRKTTEFDFEYLDYDGVMIEVVAVDDKVGSGTAGSVVYWQTDDFQKRVEFLLSLGATLYRGPMIIENGMKMCQLKDLWGNCIGIKGQ